jgi:aspartyl-tRNA(Asn)/glutamyl-tRNA(Gln) amidotransferase subunit A
VHSKTVAELVRALRAREISSAALTTHLLDRIERHKALNAFVTVDRERALAQARAADARLAKGGAPALCGVPIAQKDIFCTDGLATTCGSKMLANFVAPYDATVIEKFHTAGAVTLGKTNMDEFAMGSSTETSFFGNTLNPWDLKAVPGGSSGCSAAAVAGGLAPAATGTDTGGSIRQPAALCGITGIKPSYGRVSRYGMIAFASSLDQGGPMARTAEDCALLLNVMAGFDTRDSTSVDAPVPDFTASLNDPIKGLRIGLPKEFFSAALAPDVAGVIEDAIAEYKKLGARIVEVSLPRSDLSIPCYYVLAPAEASSNLARYDGVRYGYRAKDYGDLVDMYCRTRAEGFGAEVKRRIMIGTYVLSAGYYDAYYLKAQRLRRLITDDFNAAFEQCDVILSPTSPTTAFDIGAKTDDPVAMYLSDIYTVSVNLAGLPGISLPAGFDAGKRPVGLQLIGRYMDETRLLNAAHQYQQVTDWHKRMPPGFE